ncbi:YggT family protein [Agromyces bauzanensis]|uniref:YggT family protein n=1 Tax=Agromyces bauzanensis TaxID=1308924 RepID=A0A917PJJ0_9MICO|nr:YggT family protein [Agromyces bauzanensis]GGJ81842.1 hypothetical protein GCM10011372_20330 [Agromyces bauzanensis]
MSRTTPDALPDIHVPWYLTVLRVFAWVLYVWVIVGIVALTLRVFLILFGANPEAGFAAFVLRVSQPYMQPFRDIFPPRPVGDTGYFDVSAMFAIIIYGLLAGLVAAGIAAIGRAVMRSERRQRDELARRVLAERAGSDAATGAAGTTAPPAEVQAPPPQAWPPTS